MGLMKQLQLRASGGGRQLTSGELTAIGGVKREPKPTRKKPENKILAEPDQPL